MPVSSSVLGENASLKEFISCTFFPYLLYKTINFTLLLYHFAYRNTCTILNIIFLQAPGVTRVGLESFLEEVLTEDMSISNSAYLHHFQLLRLL